MSDSTYHYSPDLYKAVVSAISLICKGKMDIVRFFRGAGLRYSRLSELEAEVARNRDALRKHDMADELIALANEDRSDSGLALRREVIKRLVEFDNFESCWEKDQLAAMGAVAKVSSLVNQKDAFTRMAQAHDRERAARMAEAARKAEDSRKKADLRESIKRDLYAVVVMRPGRARGVAFEAVLNRIFALDGLNIRDPLRIVDDDGLGVVEQIDGVIELDTQTFLVEAKFWTESLGVGDVAQHMVRVGRRAGVSGLYVVHPGYTAPAVRSVRDELHRRVFVLATVEELVGLFEADASISDWLREKVHFAKVERDPHRLRIRNR